MSIKQEDLPESPLASANIISRLFLWWLNPIFAKGAKADLDLPDLYKTIPPDKSKHLGDRLEEEWAKELEKSRHRSQQNGGSSKSVKIKSTYCPSLTWALFRQFGCHYATLGMIAFVEECFVRVAQPLCLGYLIRYFNNPEEYQEWDGFIYAGIVLVMSGFYTLTQHPYYLGTRVIGMRIKIACCSLIYRKALRLSHASLGKTNVGQLTNIMTNDVGRFDQAGTFIHYIWVGPLQTALVTYILWGFYGPICFIGVGVLLLFVIFQSYCGKLSATLRQMTAVRTDKRIRIMNEIVSGIRVIKMYTWEKPFATLVNNSRRDEVTVIRKTTGVLGVNLALFTISSRLIIFLTLVTYVLTGNGLTAEKVFVTLALYNNLRWTMVSLFLKGVTSLGEVIVSVRRIQNFLLMEERSHDNGPTQVHSKDEDKPKNKIHSSTVGILVKNLTAKWASSHSDNTLNNLTVSIKEGAILGVIGPVGSGKSSFLQAILKELPATSGSVTVTGTIAYAPQEPWVFGGTIKDNILFGKEFNPKWYSKVVTACALQRDMELFQFGDETLVGERGVKLSGGQKARISLARAVYSKADIYLLDDPLSAVDAHVGRHLWEECICGLLAHKTRILVTHQIHFLASNDGEIELLLLERGQVQAQGSFADLLQKEIDLGNLLPSEIKNGEDEDIKGSDEVEPSHIAPETIRESKLKTIPTNVTQMEMTEKWKNSTNKVADEARQSGGVQWTTYWKYFRAGSGYFSIFMLISFHVLAQVLISGADWWLSFWTKTQKENVKVKFLSSSNSTEQFIRGSHSDVDLPHPNPHQSYDQLYIYTGIIFALLIFGIGRSLLTFWICMNASISLHDSMFGGLIRAPMRFFETNPIGRLLNRISKDIGSIDDQMPVAMYDSLEIFMGVVGIVTIVTIVNPVVLLPTMVIFGLFYLLRRYYLRTAQSVKRLEGVTRSPVFSHLSMSLNGLSTIRAYSAEDEFCKKFDDHQDMHTSSFFILIATTRWFGIWLDWLAVLFIGVVTFSFLLYSQQGSGGAQVGLAVSSAMMLTGMLQWGVRQTAEVKNHMVSVERVLEYSAIEPEPPLESEPQKAPPNDWPTAGEIVMKNVNVCYGEDDAPPVLKGVTCTFKAKEKIGIVGRTGAGKTSLITTLFRLTEPTTGTIQIDGVNILQIGLHDLRSKISIIPQDPVLFTGTLRKNLDPFDSYKDEEIWRALEEIHLAQQVKQSPAGLLVEVSEGGSNFSVGQRQLICLGRAILRKNKILVMDEATANLDNETDALIQKTIRTKFRDCTVITVAHRLHTVMDSDKIMVLDAGRVIEYDEPHKLLQDPSTALYSLVEQMDPGTADMLHKVAAEAYKCKLEAD